MITKNLPDETIRLIHKNYLVKDFPTNEVRPLKMILRNKAKGRYECLGLYDRDELKAYAFFIRCGKELLLDYLSVLPGLRDRGLGSEFIRLFAERFRDSRCIIAEVEDPSFAETEDEKTVRTRRLDFYLRNGFSLTDVKAKTFGVDFLLIELPLNGSHTKEETTAAYLGHYKATLPRFVFRRAVKIKKE